jgi:D-3-phosphoglycerate dehydrogenase
VRTLVVGDHFIPARYYVDALAGELGTRPGPAGAAAGLSPARAAAGPGGDGPGMVEAVDWTGSKEEQHTAQQEMERHGPDAVPVPAEIVGAVGDADILALHFAPVPRAVLEAGKRLRAVMVARAGVENVDVAAATQRGIAVVNVAGRNATAVAELALGLMLCEARNIARADASVKSGGWRKDFPVTPSIEIGGRTVGLVGFGHVGRALAQRLAGFGVKLLVHDPYAPATALAGAGAQAAELDDLFRGADFVSVQAKVTPQTTRFIGARQFALMKPTAYFVNVGRSRLIDTAALLRVLQRRQIAGAGLDVYDEEPLPPGSPWRRLDNVTLTTHFGGDTADTNRRSARLVAKAVAEFARTGRCAGAVNAEALGWR